MEALVHYLTGAGMFWLVNLGVWQTLWQILCFLVFALEAVAGSDMVDFDDDGSLVVGVSIIMAVFLVALHRYTLQYFARIRLSTS